MLDASPEDRKRSGLGRRCRKRGSCTETRSLRDQVVSAAIIPVEKISDLPRPKKMPRISSLSILEAREQRGTVSSSYPAGDEADDEAEGKGDKQDDGSRYGHAPEEKPHRHRLGVLNEEGSEEHAENKKGYSLRSHTLHPHT